MHFPEYAAFLVTFKFPFLNESYNYKKKKKKKHPGDCSSIFCREGTLPRP